MVTLNWRHIESIKPYTRKYKTRLRIYIREAKYIYMQVGILSEYVHFSNVHIFRNTRSVRLAVRCQSVVWGVFHQYCEETTLSGLLALSLLVYVYVLQAHGTPQCLSCSATATVTPLLPHHPPRLLYIYLHVPTHTHTYTNSNASMKLPCVGCSLCYWTRSDSVSEELHRPRAFIAAFCFLYTVVS